MLRNDKLCDISEFLACNKFYDLYSKSLNLNAYTILLVKKKAITVINLIVISILSPGCTRYNCGQLFPYFAKTHLRHTFDHPFFCSLAFFFFHHTINSIWDYLQANGSTHNIYQNTIILQHSSSSIQSCASLFIHFPLSPPIHIYPYNLSTTHQQISSTINFSINS